MIVVSDTSPLHYLVLIGHVDVLLHLYGSILVPTSVAAELAHPAASDVVRAFIANPPPWMTIQSAQQLRAANFRIADRVDVYRVQLAAPRPVAK